MNSKYTSGGWGRGVLFVLFLNQGPCLSDLEVWAAFPKRLNRLGSPETAVL